MPGPRLSFDKDTIRTHAFPAVVPEGERLCARGAVCNLRYLGSDIAATVRDTKGDHSVVIAGRLPLQYTCSCGFRYGGACSHVVAVMLAAGARDSVPVGLDFGGDSGGKAQLEEQPDVSGVREEVRDVCALPEGRLYLNEYGGVLQVVLQFAYGPEGTEFSPLEFEHSKLVSTAGGEVVRVIRAKARELALAETLEEHGLTLYRKGIYAPHGDAAAWLRQGLPGLLREGFTVFGRETLQATRTRAAAPRLGLRVAVEGHAVTCEISMSIEGIPVSLRAVFEAAVAGTKYVRLADGSSAEIPAEWLERISGFLAVAGGVPEGDTVRLTPAQVNALELLDEISDGTEWDERSRAVRERLRSAPEGAAVALPSGFIGTLRSYQHAGYRWLCRMNELALGACLADDMGLGKTVQTLALLAREQERGVSPRTSLLVVPASLLFNWSREAKRFAPRLVTTQYHGQGRARYSMKDLALADVVITTYGTAQRDAQLIEELPLNYIILDEAQMVKNPLGRTSRAVRGIPSKHRLALSGTPLENNLSELWSLFAFLNPGMLGQYRKFAEHYGRPIERDRCPHRTAALRTLTGPCIMRRTKEQVARDLPPLTENVVYCPLEPEQRVLYEITRDSFRARITQSIEEKGVEESRMQILEGLLRLRQICCHPLLMDRSYRGDSGKFGVLDSQLSEVVEGGHKLLVFSQFVSALQLVARRLDRQHVAYRVLTGSTPERGKPVDEFQNDPSIPVFLVSLKAGGVGLNLTAADYVVHLDPWWNPAAEAQASARAHRIGQTRPVFAYKLIAEDTVEERVLELQEHKKELFDSVIVAEHSLFKTLGREDVEKLFR